MIPETHRQITQLAVEFSAIEKRALLELRENLPLELYNQVEKFELCVYVHTNLVRLGYDVSREWVQNQVPHYLVNRVDRDAALWPNPNETLEEYRQRLTQKINEDLASLFQKPEENAQIIAMDIFNSLSVSI